MPTDIDRAVKELSAAEQARLPAALRQALGLADPQAAVWAAAKTARDAALAKATNDGERASAVAKWQAARARLSER